MATEQTFGARLRALRERRDMSLTDLSDETGLRIETLSRMENDKYKANPSRRTLRDLARALDVPVSELTGE